jgi:hypothetical protein
LPIWRYWSGGVNDLDAARLLRKTSAAAEGEKNQECSEQYEDEVASQEEDLEVANSPICIKMVVDGEKQRQIDLRFYMADLKSMMIGATPEAVRKIQLCILEAAGVQMMEGWQDDQLQVKEGGIQQTIFSVIRTRLTHAGT